MQLLECVSCGEDGEVCCRGLCQACRARCRRDGTIGQWGYVKADRLADFTVLRARHLVPVAAARLGVSVRTGWRYEAELKAVSPVRVTGTGQERAA